MKGIILLLKFMTRLPIGVEPKFDSDSIGKSMKFFPIVGMVIGLILFAFFWGFSGIIYTPMLMIVLLVIIEVILTGGLHLDGLADTFDGIFSYRSKQKMLDIMKDSSLGTNGGLVLILYFILKIVLIYELEMTIGLPSGIVFLLTPVIARLNSVINCASAPYARATGLGKTFVDNTNGFGVIVATVLVLLYTIVIGYLFLLPVVMLIIIPIVMLFGFIFAKLMTRKIGGVTGDTLGAVVELSEILVILLIYIFAVLFV
ncbi:adenosylcobinamide-GDP ribazoletransferase [Fusobacterium necrogenes]|uniref:adenosylcobinamide-GDP ribazoletransferase n=1 Tax=Fusobacterium necrogenes TaxID=858 RepID=UPI00255CE031|nr:adenosylcobinamide-GDP ribazoletransferase [Fusobacterium necrogenes]